MGQTNERHCERCGHTWKARVKDREPVQCPECRSPYWRNSRRNKPAQTKTEART
jgi:predicted Zn-ribbon and HTH transcriptional regulator